MSPAARTGENARWQLDADADADADAGTLQALVPEVEWAARDRAQLPPALKVANSHGVGREWVSAFRRNAPAAQEGAGTWL